MKKKLVIYLIVLMLSIIAIIGTSAAYLMIDVIKDYDNGVALTAKQLSIEFTDSPVITLDGALPGLKVIKTFSVTNTGTTPIQYNLSFVDVINEFSRTDDLVFTLTSNNSSFHVNSATKMPTEDLTFGQNITINSNTTHNYTLTVEYKNLNVNQAADMNKNVSFTINVDDTTVRYGTKLMPGLYTMNDELVYTWDELIDEGAVSVSDGVITNSMYSDGKDLLDGKLVLADDVTALSYDAFSYSPLKSVVVSTSVVTIEDSAFTGCTDLESFTFEEGSNLKRISYMAFVDTGEFDLVLPEGFETVGNSAFYHSGIKSIYLPSSLIAIEQSAFEGCDNLKTVTFAQNPTLTSIPERSFYNVHIETVNIPEGITTIETSAFDGTNLTSITLPSTLTTIEDYAFYSSALESITIPANVTTIEEYAFDNNNLGSISFAPNSHLTTIGESAFDDSYNVSEVYVPSSVTSIGSYAFGGVDTIYYSGSAIDNDNNYWGANNLVN